MLSELRLPGIHLISLGELEENDRQLGLVKSTRSLLEYYLTCNHSARRYLYLVTIRM